MKLKLIYASSVLLLFVLLLTACGSDESNSANQNDNSDSENNGSGTTELEILSWWTSGGEAEALNAVIDGFGEEEPNIEIVNAAVAGGGGSNSQAVLSSRLQGGEPPAVFQAQGGFDLLRWQEGDYLQSLNDLYEENGWRDVFPETIIDMNTIDGEIYGIPMNVHRNNMIWYNKKIFDDNGIEPPKTFADFFEIADTLQSKGIIPLALGDQNPRWSTLLFEMALLNELGAEDFSALWTGNEDFDTAKIRSAVNTFSRMLDYTNENHSSLDWQDAADLVASDEAAMLIMGDWASGFFMSRDLVANEDFGWVAAPGTEDIFNIVNDSMGYPTGVENAEEAEGFLAYLGSAEAQAEFNQLKGSIPARTDIDVSDFSEYSQSAAEDFKNLELNLSLAGGSPVPAGFLSRVDDAINTFVTQRDPDMLINSLEEAKSLLQE
ncbi:ABC transporter substrate-binding protein [Gracilibacillus alcaliphilus]|uniref:ABC transporter substrate-binding protein n=1 Tax=Gracilibacillus alcaliphilus TaxID=1401441 RepID=UPI00195ED244|nr:ABC transporter substrate-binding protein [Gracilibacillus alcaliphilus]MBM7676829.1 glucose/mannose transport system substrate-binding protein [Gracilibacillus alcaliphilus]